MANLKVNSKVKLSKNFKTVAENIGLLGNYLMDDTFIIKNIEVQNYEYDNKHYTNQLVTLDHAFDTTKPYDCTICGDHLTLV